MRKEILCAAFMVLCLLVVPAVAAEKAGPTKNSEDKPIPDIAEVEEFRLIHADSMTLTRRKDEPQVFEGSVDIIMVDKKGQETRLKADTMTIYYEQDLKKLQRIEAKGKVEIHRLGTIATTESALYRGDTNTIELLVNPHVKDSRGELSADKITIFVDSDKVVAEGNVKGIVHPKAVEDAAAK